MIDDSLQLLACKYLHNQLEKLQKELAGARLADDIECVHHSRVASRRMRAGLRFFDGCFPAKKMKKWVSQIKKVTKKLGQARDRDVQIEFIKDFLSNLDKAQKPFKTGINRLLLRLRQGREKIQPKVVESIDGFDASGVLADMHGEIEKVLFSFRGEDVPLLSQIVVRHIREQVAGQLEELLSHQNTLSDPSDKKGHHQMRISAKRLRYTLEICDMAFDGELKEIIKVLKKAQTCLGDVHDSDVWGDYLDQFINEEKQRTVEYYGHARSFASIRKGLDYLKSKCAERRDRLFGEFAEDWNRIGEEGLWDKLRAIIDARLEEDQDSEMNPTA
ncbi:MAG: CHAD domain-containing protein [Sedimentisphaerales bacterium]|jgi:CHAD domain-containing protein